MSTYDIGQGSVVGQFFAAIVDDPSAGSNPESVPAVGTVTFTPSAGMLINNSTLPNPSVILRSPIVCPLDSEGYLCAPGTTDRGVYLMATDDSRINPEGWVWEVLYDFKHPNGTPLRTMPKQYIKVPTGGTVDLVTTLPLERSNGVFITKGDKGDPGLDGPQGPEGPQGIPGTAAYKGDTGDTGPVGPQGPQGVAGPQGIQGPTGLTGATGPQGLKGDKGDTGATGPKGADSTVAGPTGPQGPKGDTGLQGPVGAASTVPGPTGPTGPQGPKGDTGDQGIRGGHWYYSDTDHADYTDVVGMVEGDIFLYQNSRDFFQYTNGSWVYGGNIGAIKGDTGPQGPQGIQGPQGEIGPQGVQGAKGDTGAQGMAGPAGMQWRGSWDAGTDYVLDDAVYYNGGSWFAAGDPPAGEVPSDTSAYWNPLALRGLQGPTGPDGAQGTQGPQGPQGVQGIQGPTGDTGPKGDTGATGPAGAGINGGRVFIQSTAPASPLANDIWIW